MITSSPVMPLSVQTLVMLRYASSRLVAMKLGSYLWKTKGTNVSIISSSQQILALYVSSSFCND